MKFDDYLTEGFYDEMFQADGRPRSTSAALFQRLSALSDGELQRRQKAADLTLLDMGITFNVYGHAAGTEKIWPFDLVPRIVAAAEWDFIERGLKQRIHALNLFIDDIYHEQTDHPRRRRARGTAHLGQVSPQAVRRPDRRRGGMWCHITGTDLVRDGDGQMYVLEDNLRCPSGVSYVLENREVMKRTFPQVFEGLTDPAGGRLSRAAAGHAAIHRSARHGSRPNVVLLTPGVYNSAYFEHSLPGPADGRLNWSRAATWWWPTATSTCAPPRDSSAWT